VFPPTGLLFIVGYSIHPACGGREGREMWGHPTPRQRAMPSALLSDRAACTGERRVMWGHPTPRQRAMPSALLSESCPWAGEKRVVKGSANWG